MGTNDNGVLHELSLVKSNEMISAKYNSTLLENQVMAIALSRIEQPKDPDRPLYAKFYPGELKKLVSDSTHIYRDLKALSKSITGHTMFLEDGKGNFKAYSIVPSAEYEDGVFTIKFNEDLRRHILGLERNFTTLSLSVMTNFDRNSSFRLYELLRKDLYKSKKSVNEGRVDVEYNLSELRFTIGIANSDNSKVQQKIKTMGREIDWDVLYAACDPKDKKYKDNTDFKTKVLDPARIELEEKSDIRFEYEDGAKKGKKLLSLIFHIYPNEPSVEVLERQKELDEIDFQYTFPRDYSPIYKDLIGHNDLTADDIDILYQKAGGDEELIRDAISAADSQEYIRNYMGWVIRYIERGGYDSIETINGSADDAKKVNNLMHAFEADKENAAFRVWEKAKTKEDFSEFLNYLKFDSVEEFEIIYDSPTEAYQLYIDWKKGEI